MTNFFVTFSVPHLFQNDEKFYVVCENDEQAKEVARDAYSLDGVKNIRIRKCSKPRNRLPINYKEYWEYKWF